MEFGIRKSVSRIIIASLLVCLSACVNHPRVPLNNQAARGAIYGAAGGAVVGSMGGIGAMGGVLGGAAGYIIGYDIRRNMTQMQLIEVELQRAGVQFVRLGSEYKLVLPADYFFYLDAPRLNYTGRYYLNEIARYLTFFDVTSMRVVGFTDNAGLPERNLAMSHARAQTVVAYLTKHKLDIRLMSARGFGADYPIATNRDPKGRALNRRVEIIFRFNLCPADKGRWFWPDLADCQKWVTTSERFVRVD